MAVTDHDEINYVARKLASLKQLDLSENTWRVISLMAILASQKYRDKTTDHQLPPQVSLRT